jgi:catechol 2,3-dioxygenase-like lactoylglutathione lyase family enzyme
MAAVRYIVDDVDAALEFYTGHLGFEVIERMGPPFALIARDGLRLCLSGPGTSARRPMPDGREPEPGGWNRLVIEVEDIEATVAGMRGMGATFRNEIISGPGGRQIVVDDPSGNPIEVFQPA